MASVLEVNLFAVGDLALVHAKGKAALRIRADPGLEQHRSAFLPVIRERNQRSAVALQALREIHRRLLPYAPPERGTHPNGAGRYRKDK